MSHKAKSILKHTVVMLLCIALCAGSFLLSQYVYETGGSARNNARQLLGVFIFFISLLFAVGVFVHFWMLLSNARVHCKNCGAMGSLRDYQVLKRNMATDKIHVLSEDIQLNMYCSACGSEFPLKRRFRASSYSNKHRVWKIINVDKAVREYASGKLWF